MKYRWLPLLLILAGILIIQSGCTWFAEMAAASSEQVNYSTTIAESNEQTSASDETTQLSPTPNQTESGDESGHNQSDDVSIEIKQEAAPDIEGTKKSIAIINGIERVVYIALPDNTYGIDSGKIVGEYKHEVFIEDDQTGGITLAAPIISVLLEKALSELPPQETHWLLTLPVDLSDCRSDRPIIIDLSAEPMIDRPYYIRITAADEELGLINILDQSQQVVIEKFWIYDLHYVISQKSSESQKIIEGEEMDFLFVIAPFQTPPPTDHSYTYGDRVGMINGPVLAGLTSVRGPFREHDYNCILKADGCPVFIMANDKLQQ